MSDDIHFYLLEVLSIYKSNHFAANITGVFTLCMFAFVHVDLYLLYYYTLMVAISVST